MKKIAKLILSLAIAAGTLLPLSQQSFAAQPNHVIISEVYYDTNLSNRAGGVHCCY